MRCEWTLQAPGVYIDGDKIAALGLRVRRGYSCHGLSFNVDMDLAPYARIVPCGLVGTGVTMLKALGPASTVAEVTPALVAQLAKTYGSTPRGGCKALRFRQRINWARDWQTLHRRSMR